MSKHSFPFYKEQLEMILAVTKMLNEHSEGIPVDPHYYFKVQLVDSHDETVVGEWSDEIGPDCWEFSLAPSQIAEVKPTFQLPQSNVPGARGVAIPSGVVLRTGNGIEISAEGTKGL